ncbi:MAG: CPBP family intramembrane metalloprotease [Bacilli bacterium]|nr:CPBP family intramembrane metalloprotease [Bacilli bacterium]
MIFETIKSIIKFMCLFVIYAIVSSITVARINNIYLSTLIPALVVIIISFFINKDELKTSIKNIKKDFNKKIFIFGIITCILSIIINLILTKVIGHTSNNQTLLIENIHKYKLLYVLIITFIVPLCEEFLFRLPYSKSKNIFTFILSIIIFTLLHINSTSDFIFIGAYIIPTIGLTLNYFKTNNIYISYMLHALNNLINVLLLIW